MGMRLKESIFQMANTRRSLEDRFWSKVVKTDCCWIWTGGRFQNGYGKITIDGKQQRAHRVAFEMEFGPLPEDALLEHTCGNRLCVNPAHLRIGGTRRVRVYDPSRINRSRVAKLSEDEVKDIRRQYAEHTMTQRDLATTYGVSLATVQSIIYRRSWKHVES